MRNPFPPEWPDGAVHRCPRDADGLAPPADLPHEWRCQLNRLSVRLRRSGDWQPGRLVRMRWDDLFADLEAQARELADGQRSGEIEERTRAETARIAVVDRLRPAVGSQLKLRCSGGASVSGTLVRVNREWLLIDAGAGREAWVIAREIVMVIGLGRLSAVPGSSGVVESRLGLRHALRAIARDRSILRVRLIDGSVLDGTLDRVGADFAEIALHPAGEIRRRAVVREVAVVPFGALAVLERES